jgi:hypothetical protein
MVFELKKTMKKEGRQGDNVLMDACYYFLHIIMLLISRTHPDGSSTCSHLLHTSQSSSIRLKRNRNGEKVSGIYE